MRASALESKTVISHKERLDQNQKIITLIRSKLLPLAKDKVWYRQLSMEPCSLPLNWHPSTTRPLQPREKPHLKSACSFQSTLSTSTTRWWRRRKVFWKARKYPKVLKPIGLGSTWTSTWAYSKLRATSRMRKWTKYGKKPRGLGRKSRISWLTQTSTERANILARRTRVCWTPASGRGWTIAS